MIRFDLFSWFDFKTKQNKTSVQFTFVLFGEEKAREEEEGGMVSVAKAVDVVAMPTTST